MIHYDHRRSLRNDQRASAISHRTCPVTYSLCRSVIRRVLTPDLAARLRGFRRAVTLIDAARTIGAQAATAGPVAQTFGASAAVRATGTTFRAASTSGTSSRADNRQQARISAPVKSASTGRGWPGIRNPCSMSTSPAASSARGKAGRSRGGRRGARGFRSTGR